MEQTDIVLWTNSAVHHEPRHEDGKPNSAPRIWPGDDAWEGSALLMWSGFDLRPRNLFDRTPFYPYSPPAPARPGANARPNADRGRRKRSRPRWARRAPRPDGESFALFLSQIHTARPHANRATLMF